MIVGLGVDLIDIERVKQKRCQELIYIFLDGKFFIAGQ
jgi:phosphopantetheinyl transferase (holo-ACP synthase)